MRASISKKQMREGKKVMKKTSLLIFIAIGIFLIVLANLDVRQIEVGRVSFANPVSRITGFIVSDEDIVEKFDKNVDLEVKKPPQLAGRVMSENKNERMDFELVGGRLRLYFDLLNYSEFIANSIAKEEASVGGDVEEIETGYGQTGYGSETGYGIVGVLNFFTLIGRVVGIGEEQTGYGSETDYGKQEIINLSEVKEIVSNLSEGELDAITEQAVVELSEEEFEIEVNETKAEEQGVEYKWGYSVEIKDLKFMAKIDVSSEIEIIKYNEGSLRIGNNILSFKDLADEGYNVRIEKPALEIEIENLTIPRIIENFSIINKTEEEITKKVENITETPESVTIINETETTEPEIKEPAGEEIEKKESKEEIEKLEGEGEKDKIEKEKPKEKEEKKEKIKEKEEKVKKEKKQTGYGKEIEEGYGITGNIIKFIYRITGKVTGFIVGSAIPEIQDVEYENKISVYIEKDFSEINDNIVSVEKLNSEQVDYGSGYGTINQPNDIKITYRSRADSSENSSVSYLIFNDVNGDEMISIGDVVYLDPSLILITKAQHLDENRSFVSDIYEQVKEKDDNWSEIINKGHYVRVTFERNLTKENDITVYARVADNCTMGRISIVINNTEVACEVYEKKKRIDEIRRLLNQ